MPKQIKIGFDRTTGTKIPSLSPLQDYGTGLPLVNEVSQPLYTEELAAQKGFYASRNALSTYVNNQKAPIKVVEQFPETSQVSSSLLGVPRAEEQLGLFSDVSVYGFNNNIWEFITLGPGLVNQPPEWVSRKNKTYGKRTSIGAVEVHEEQAIALKAFPIGWSFPHDINFSKLGLYNQNLYEQYRRFFELGRYMYDTFLNDYNDEVYEAFAEENFLPPWVGSIQDVTGVLDDAPITVKTVVYNPDINSEDVFAELEKWTVAWMKMRDGALFLPNGRRVDFPLDSETGNYLYTPADTRPGYSSTSRYYGTIESKKAFRYQPGRISGFTFGLRASPDQASLDNTIEWGAANSTDQYMFQIRGPNFAIVRRSTVPLPDQNIMDMGIDPSKQIVSGNAPGKFDPDTGLFVLGAPIYELVISKDFFNKDQMDGTGPSGHILNFEKVTMYKIEFSWYGAIGAKFYAYVPASNGDARWVLMHTLVIENKIGKPCLNDPYFKFKYVLDIRNTEYLYTPQFVYKYGASYYIDGGDEGSATNYSINSEETEVSIFNTRSVLGLYPKNTITNREGFEIRNKKDVIPTMLTVSTDNPIRLDIIECEGCPGFGHHFAPSLVNGQFSSFDEFSVSLDGKYIQYTDTNKSFSVSDINKKIMGNGVYSAYIDSVSEDLTRAYIKRKPGENNRADKQGIGEAGNTFTFEYTKKIEYANGQLADIRGNVFNLRLNGYSSVVASDIQLTKPNIEINFLNPYKKDSLIPKAFANFYIGVVPSNLAPSVVSGELLFGNSPYNKNDALYAEWSEQTVNLDYKGNEVSEIETRSLTTFEVNDQIPSISGEDGGICSKLSVRVTEFTVNAEFVTIRNNIEGNYLSFTDSIFKDLRGLDNGQIGIINPSTGLSEASTSIFTEDKAVLVRVNNQDNYVIEVNNADLVNVDRIVFRVVRIFGSIVNKTRVFGVFNIFPLYVVIGLSDYAQVNNITIEEYDNISKFSYSPTWLKSDNSTVVVNDSGNDTESFSSDGFFNSGGNSIEGFPPTNFLEIDRLSSILTDKQLQQPLRRGAVRSTVFLGENETRQFNLDYLFGQDRYLITPGLYNTKATFFTAKALNEPAKTQITLNVKEQ